MMYYIYIYVLKLLHHHYFDPLERDQRSCGLEREGEIGREGKGRERVCNLRLLRASKSSPDPFEKSQNKAKRNSKYNEHKF